MVKDGYEINEMRKAVDATKHGFDRLLSALPAALDKPRSERILEGAFNAVSRELGNAIGYDSIVASGPHAPDSALDAQYRCGEDRRHAAGGCRR